ncbi:MAG TPA: hypothetical protein VFX20_12660 [Steroidobacteraceae bacterium]|nr:hypothetical protein [Steroidobacteraceae bacterium]
MRPESVVGLSPPWTATSQNIDAALTRLYTRRWILVLGGILGIIAGIVIGMMSTRIYEATVAIAPAKPDNAASAAMQSNLGSLAAMVGMPFPGEQRDDASINLAYLESRQFAASFIQQHGMMELLYPKRGGGAAAAREPPTMGNAVRYFDRKMRTINKDRSSGLIMLSVNWRDRFEAAQWANEMVAEINEEARNRAISEAQRSLKYLNGELQRTTVVELRDAIYQLVEQNIKSIMLANARRDFAFEVIDPATVPDANRYIRPNWVFNIISGLMIGMTLAALAALLMRPKVMVAIQESDARIANVRDREVTEQICSPVDGEYNQ